MANPIMAPVKSLPLRGGGGTFFDAAAASAAAPEAAVLAGRAPAEAAGRHGEQPRSRAPRMERRNALAAAEEAMADVDGWRAGGGGDGRSGRRREQAQAEGNKETVLGGLWTQLGWAFQIGRAHV